MNKLNIKHGNPIPGHFQFFALLILIAGIWILLTNIIAGVILSLIGGIMLTMRSGILFNMGDNTYQEYYSILFYRLGEVCKFDGIHKLYINKSNVSQTIYTAHTASSRAFRDELYTAYVMFPNGKKLKLFSGKQKEKVAQTARSLSKVYNVEITDNTI